MSDPGFLVDFTPLVGSTDDPHYRRGPIRIAHVIAATTKLSGLTRADIIGESRRRQVRPWRRAAHYVARELTGQSLPRIGRSFHRDHTTSLFNYRKMLAQLQADPSSGALVHAVMEETRRLAGVAS